MLRALTGSRRLPPRLRGTMWSRVNDHGDRGSSAGLM
jgi:hypothetical protein